LRPAAGSIIGRRDEQQDAACFEAFEDRHGRRGHLLVVADGMGGHAGGREASAIAVEAFCDRFALESSALIPDRLHLSLEAANRAVGNRVEARPDLAEMGCTLVAAVLVGDRLDWISVGDSLLLAIRDRQVVRLNADHSLAPEIDRAAREGRISPADAKDHPDRHILLAALSGGLLSLVDSGSRRLGKNAFVILASDGILTLDDRSIAEIVCGSRSADQAVQRLLAAVESAMSEDQDNTSIVAILCGGPAKAKKSRARLALGSVMLMTALGGATCVTLILREERMARQAAPARPPARPIARVSTTASQTRSATVSTSVAPKPARADPGGAARPAAPTPETLRRKEAYLHPPSPDDDAGGKSGPSTRSRASSGTVEPGHPRRSGHREGRAGGIRVSPQ